jgi:hypothetical protein
MAIYPIDLNSSEEERQKRIVEIAECIKEMEEYVFPHHFPLGDMSRAAVALASLILKKEIKRGAGI